MKKKKKLKKKQKNKEIPLDKKIKKYQEVVQGDKIENFDDEL